MKLEFRILWFEDQPDSVNSFNENLRDRLEVEGFFLKTVWVEDFRNINSEDNLDQFIQNIKLKYFQNQYFDLIFMDYNLGNSLINGAKLAKKIRTGEASNFSDIIFYSSNSPNELRKIMFDNGVDGVFCVNRKDVVADGMKVISSHIQKIVDLSHMRGIVIDSVSDLDIQLNKVISSIYNKSSSNNKIKYLKNIKEKIQSTHRDSNLLKTIANHESENSLEILDIENVVTAREFSSYIKQATLISMLKSCKTHPDICDCFSELSSSYRTEVIDIRNTLAHQNETMVKEKYTQGDFCDLRLKIIKHKKNLCNIEKTVNSDELTQHFIK